ncbi:hypothetical protein SY85_18540 [Flavisolibacter tropicus]|uniref:DUF2306 domain-containing protein n=2 Tax=Flavisolibacter tropicus TaxID=1492898 RepID=A0A172U3I0_9BACT|nr:hypothetical protein SY85_18540 [Flavisolibacter tropicus]
MAVPATKLISKFGLLLIAIYLFFCYFMVEIVAQYIPVGADTAFLGIKQEYIDIPFYLPVFYIHVFTAILALPSGFTQFSRYILKRWPTVHRLNGRVYIISILLLGAPSGFIIGLYANGGLPSRISFCLLGVLWMYFTWQAYAEARKRNIQRHKAFMYRSFALTLSAITLRAWKYVLIAIFHPRPMDVYQLIAWLGWVPNLLIAEYLLTQKRPK